MTEARVQTVDGRSSFPPFATIFSAPSGSGRCNFSASSGGALIHKSISAGVRRITGIAFGMDGADLRIWRRREES